MTGTPTVTIADFDRAAFGFLEAYVKASPEKREEFRSALASTMVTAQQAADGLKALRSLGSGERAQEGRPPACLMHPCPGHADLIGVLHFHDA